MKEANELLRSAHEIARRKGVNTNWTAFETNLRRELLKQAGRPEDTDEQIILRATCTPKTYRLPDGVTLIDDIEQAQVTAGENAVLDNLRRMGL